MNHGGCTGNQMLKLLPPKDIDGMLFESAPWTRDAPEIADFRNRYRAAFRIDPQIISAVGYLDIIWLARAMEAAKNVSNPSAIRAAMPGALGKLRPNLLGWSNLDASGDIEWPMHISYVKNGVTQNFTGK
jgi:ABC-type branched-subunit amino acid transport system substrate-binding protein